MRCVFMVASKYGLKCFDAVRELGIIEVAGVITPKQEYELKYGGKHSKEMKNEIYTDLLQRCNYFHIPFYAMDKMNDTSTEQKVMEWKAELIVVSGWYHLIGKKILNVPGKGVIGLHSSLLPKYRGGAPLVWQIINGEEFTGITLFYINDGAVDSGDIIGQRKIKIEYSDTIGTLYERVGEEGISLLRENLPLIALGKAPRMEQVGLSDKDIFPQRSPKDGLINWDKTSKQIYDFIRAQTKPYPGSFTYYMGYKVIIWSCKVMPYRAKIENPGVILNIVIEDGKSKPIISTTDKDRAIKIEDCLILDKNNREMKAEKIFEEGRRIKAMKFDSFENMSDCEKEIKNGKN